MLAASSKERKTVGRTPKCRRVEHYPLVTTFKPAGAPRRFLEKVSLLVEELEALRLKDYLGLEQEECAQKMQVSRPTFQRILMEARKKVVEALINGKELHIDGGEYCLGSGHCRRMQHRSERSASCPYLDDYMKESPAAITNKIAICSTGDLPSSKLDGRFGRCAYFLLWNPATGSFESLPNHDNDLDQGAGASTAQALLNKGIKAVVASRIGPKAFAVLQRGGVAVYEGPEGIDAASAVKKLEANQLPVLERPNQ